MYNRMFAKLAFLFLQPRFLATLGAAAIWLLATCLQIHSGLVYGQETQSAALPGSVIKKHAGEIDQVQPFVSNPLAQSM
jgi:hypothetical protein